MGIRLAGVCVVCVFVGYSGYCFVDGVLGLILSFACGFDCVVWCLVRCCGNAFGVGLVGSGGCLFL